MIVISQNGTVLLNLGNVEGLFITETNENEFVIATITNPNLYICKCSKLETAKNFLQEIAMNVSKGTKVFLMPEYIAEKEE